MLLGQPIRQIAYFVNDVKDAARRHSALFGSGPYYIAENIPLRSCLHRGQPAQLDHTSAYGQWGDLMIEFVQQNNPGPSAFRDMYPEPSEGGIHHTAVIVDDLAAAIQAFNRQGHETALYAEMNSGFAFAMMDTVAAYGHMVELYMPAPELTGFYDFVKSAAKDFDGSDPIRAIQFD